MQAVPAEVWAKLERRLEEARVPAAERADYRKWVRFYLDFCHKYGHPAAAPTSLGPFLGKLASKHQSVVQRSQARAAIGLLLQAGPEPGAPGRALTAAPARSRCAPLHGQPTRLAGASERPDLNPQPPNLKALAPTAPPQTPKAAEGLGRGAPAEGGLPEGSRAGREDRAAAPAPDRAVRDARPARAPAPGGGACWQQEYRELEAAILLRNYSMRTLEAYRFWIAKFQVSCSHPTAWWGCCCTAAVCAWRSASTCVWSA